MPIIGFVMAFATERPAYAAWPFRRSAGSGMDRRPPSPPACRTGIINNVNRV